MDDRGGSAKRPRRSGTTAPLGTAMNHFGILAASPGRPFPVYADARRHFDIVTAAEMHSTGAVTPDAQFWDK